ncbi:MAG: hypothetical protein ACI9W4_000498 [Rhodothermales bacterium]|jgi:hypothetical protein
MNSTVKLVALLAIVATASAACDSNSITDENAEPLQSVLAENIPADPIVGVVQGRPVGAGLVTYYSLRTNSMVSGPTSEEWDLALQGTSIFVNAGTSGPGNGGVQIVEGTFEELTEAPVGGYTVDSTDGTAIPAGSGNGWYNYNPATNAITPIPGRVLVIRTADGRFAKIKILNYYRDSPAEITAASESRYYTFEYVLQANGSRAF